MTFLDLSEDKYLEYDFCFIFINEINLKLKMSSVKIKDTTQIELNLKDDGKLDGRYYTLEQVNDCLQCFFCCFCESSN